MFSQYSLYAPLKCSMLNNRLMERLYIRVVVDPMKLLLILPLLTLKLVLILLAIASLAVVLLAVLVIVLQCKSTLHAVMC
jgi:hypothetical protein